MNTNLFTTISVLHEDKKLLLKLMRALKRKEGLDLTQSGAIKYLATKELARLK